MEHQSLLSILTNIFLCRDSEYCSIWKPNSTGLFSTRSFYREIHPFSEVWSPCALVWTGLAPPRVEAFCWLAVAGKISTAYALRRNGLMSNSISDMCSLRGRELESIDHFFIHCDIASFIWGVFSKNVALVDAFQATKQRCLRLGGGVRCLEMLYSYCKTPTPNSRV